MAKVSVTLDASGYGADKDALTAKGFILEIGEYGDPLRATVKMDFAQGIALLNELVAADKALHYAVATRLAETGQLAALAVANAQDAS